MTTEINLSEYLRPLLRWWWLIVASVLVACISSVAYSMMQPAIYQSSATLLVGSNLSDPNPNGGEFYLAQQLADTYADIANRSIVRQATMDALGLSWLPGYVVSPVPNRPVIQVAVYGEDPQTVYAVAQELVRQIILLGPQGAEEHERTAFAQDQLAKMEISIAETEEELVRQNDELLTLNSAREIATKQTQIAALEAKLTTLRQNYAQLLATTQTGAVNALRLIETPYLPDQPLGSKLLTHLVVAFALAFALAAAGAYLLDYLDNTFRDPEEMKRSLNVTLLGSVPTLTGRNESSSDTLLLQLGRLTIGEAYRRIRTNLEFVEVDRMLRVMLITSPQVRDGKSTTAANLSVMLAGAGKKVVLVDADLHRPTQQHTFKLPNHRGLTTALLTEGLNLEELLQPTAIANLSVLTSGPLPPNPAELLSTRRFQEILTTLRTAADIVIIDSPPITAVVDSLILTAMVDGLLLVVRAGKTRRDAAKQALSAIQQVHAHLLGAVLVDVPEPHTRFYTQEYGYYNEAYQRAANTQTNGTGRRTAGRSPEADDADRDSFAHSPPAPMVEHAPDAVAEAAVAQAAVAQAAVAQAAVAQEAVSAPQPNGLGEHSASNPSKAATGIKTMNGSHPPARRRSGLPWR